MRPNTKQNTVLRKLNIQKLNGWSVHYCIKYKQIQILPHDLAKLMLNQGTRFLYILPVLHQKDRASPHFKFRNIQESADALM